ncbi:ribosomal protection-like ABC-F family protein [Paenibacillus glacialis]|uniref:ABC transporter ATP-binding protein n=1 Tax=Paenibacillus glacialis TaxID=494026 RepID=A0A168NR72_9BACL|nr:ABC-F type ribosomal protection protein [Paenibacillus glacialis]OAB46050.1 ABC transporter ATP-binding protein [Paenibacillus glacialis]
MMNIVRGRNLAKEWQGKVCFEQVDIDIYEGERIALFGSNGVGKTTLLEILAGEEKPTEGTIERGLPLAQWGVMKQTSAGLLGMTTLEAAQVDSTELYQIKCHIKRLEDELGHRTNTIVSNESLLEEYGHWLERYEQMDGFKWEVDVEKILNVLHIGVELWGMPFSQLSGGQKTRVRLASLLVHRPKFLILDEPTNHLDESSILWLENWLTHYEGTVLFVSHDRTFLDQVATGVCELTNQGLKKYNGGYRDYRREKDREIREQESLYKQQQLARKALEESIRRYQEWFNKADQAASKQEMPSATSFYKSKAKKNISRYHAKQKEMERLDAQSVQKPRNAPSIKMNLEAEGFAARHFLELKQVTFGFTEHTILIDRLDLLLSRGDRLAVRGPNGTGKSTLLQLMMNKLIPQAGEVRAHPRLKIGYFSQELEGLDLEKTLLDSLLTLPGMTETNARTILGCFLFSRENVFKRIGDLSMGEKCRAAFLQLYFSGANLLVLDEPTNYLDIATREVIEDALQSYSGAFIIVSHDRMLVRKLANRLLTLSEDQKPRLFEGTVEDEEEHIKRRERVGRSDDSSQENERIELEWTLARLLSDEGGTEVEEMERLQSIRMLQKQLKSF